MDPTLSVATTLSLGVVTSWGLASSLRASWDVCKRLGRQLGIQLLWYGSLGTLTFAIAKHVEGIARERMEEWIAYGCWARGQVDAWHVAASSWLDLNWYPAVATVATLLLVVLQCVSRSKVVDDQGSSVSAKDKTEPQRASVFQSATEVIEALPVQPHPKIEEKKNSSLALTDQWLSLQETLMQRITELESSIASLSYLRTEVQQLKEVIVSQSFRMDKIESTKSAVKEEDINQGEAEVLAAFNRGRSKRTRVEESSGDNKGLTEKEVIEMIGKTKNELLREFREELRAEALSKREPFYLTAEEVALAMKDLAELDRQWRQGRRLPLRDSDYRPIGALTAEQAQLQRREVREIIKARRDEDFANRMRDSGRPVMRCTNCNRQFLVERGHRCYVAQWKIETPKGPLPLDRKIVISQTGKGAIQMKPVTQVDPTRVDETLKRIQNYKLVHDNTKPGSYVAQGPRNNKPDVPPKNEELVIAIEDSGERDPHSASTNPQLEAKVNRLEAEFQALIEGIRRNVPSSSAPFQGIREIQESPPMEN